MISLDGEPNFLPCLPWDSRRQMALPSNRLGRLHPMCSQGARSKGKDLVGPEGSQISPVLAWEKVWEVFLLNLREISTWVPSDSLNRDLFEFGLIWN